MITLNAIRNPVNAAIPAPASVTPGTGSQTTRPAALPEPYPISKASPAFAMYHGFTDTNEPVLRRVF